MFVAVLNKVSMGCHRSLCNFSFSGTVNWKTGRITIAQGNNDLVCFILFHGCDNMHLFYSRTSLTRASKGNQKKFELAGLMLNFKFPVNYNWFEVLLFFTITGYFGTL